MAQTSFEGFGVKASSGIFSNGAFQNLSDNIFNSQGTIDCGARPTCLGWSEGCKQKQKEYYDCTKVAAKGRSAATVASAKFAVMMIAAVVVIIVVLVIAFRKPAR